MCGPQLCGRIFDEFPPFYMPLYTMQWLTVCAMLCASLLHVLQVHAEGEAEHAAIGHNAVLNLVPREHIPILQQAMADHDRDFAVFYNRMAELLEGSATH